MKKKFKVIIKSDPRFKFSVSNVSKITSVLANIRVFSYLNGFNPHVLINCKNLLNKKSFIGLGRLREIIKGFSDVNIKSNIYIYFKSILKSKVFINNPHNINCKSTVKLRGENNIKKNVKLNISSVIAKFIKLEVHDPKILESIDNLELIELDATEIS